MNQPLFTSKILYASLAAVFAVGCTDKPVGSVAPTPMPVVAMAPAKAEPAPASVVATESKVHVNQAFSYIASAKASAVSSTRDEMFRAAEAELNAALKLSPDFLDAIVARGTLNMAQGKLNKAENDLKDALKLAPTHAVAHYNLACVYSLQNKLDLASDAIASALGHGFDDIESLKKDPDLKALRATGDWKKIMEKNKIFI